MLGASEDKDANTAGNIAQAAIKNALTLSDEEFVKGMPSKFAAYVRKSLQSVLNFCKPKSDKYSCFLEWLGTITVSKNSAKSSEMVAGRKSKEITDRNRTQDPLV